MPPEVTGSAADVPPEALVIRFRPTDPQKVLESAAKEHRLTGHYRLSVFADSPRPGETEAQLRLRLVQAAGLSGIDLNNQRKYFVCTQAKELLDSPFTFWKDGDDDEKDEHYSVDLGDEPTVDDVKRFLAAFPGEQRWP